MRLPGEYVARLRPHYQGLRVCVTGGAGFIGGHLVDALYALGADATVIDDLSTSAADHLASLIELDAERVRLVHGSILDDRALAAAAEGAHVVFHLAALSSVPRSLEDPSRSFEVNAVGTLRVAEAARAAGAGRVVYSASSSAYGDQGASAAPVPKRESQVPRPQSPYAAGKLAGEGVMHSWAHSYGLSTISLRYFNVFGPRQRADSPYAAVVPMFIRALLAGDEPAVHGDGRQSRDFTYIASAVLANLLAGASPRPLAGEVVNIGSGRSTEILDLFQMLANRCGRPHAAPRLLPPRPGDVRHSLADLTLAGELLGYTPITSLEEGLDETVAWARSTMVSS